MVKDIFYVTPFYTNMDLLGLDLYLCCIKLLIYILVITASSKKIIRPCVGLRFASLRGEILLSMAISLYSLYLFFFILFWFVLFFLFAVTFVKYFLVCKTPIQVHSCIKYFALFKKKKRNKLILMKSGCAI